MRTFSGILLILILSVSLTFSQTYNVPELLYYKFNDAGVDSAQNFASPGVGSAYAPILGMTQGGAGMFGAALVGTGSSSTSNYVNTNWATSLSSTGSFTIGMWLSNLPVGSTTLYYFFGDNTASSFRCFMNGIAGSNNIMIRGTGMTDLVVAGVAPGPSYVHFVYDATAGTMTGYLNGTQVSSVSAGTFTFSGTGPLKVGGYSSLNCLPTDAFMDEFRLYDRALDATEISFTYNQTLPFVVPVELTSFSASVNGNDVTLNWSTATETNNSGFEVERKSGSGEFEQIAFVAGFGTVTEPKTYLFEDESLQPGTYSYRLKQVDFDGTFEYSQVVEVEILAPAEYSLQQNYPNPFNPSTTIQFSLASDASVKLKLYNVLGQEEKVLIDHSMNAGNHTFNLNADGLNSGVYFYTLEAAGADGSNFIETRKMILMK